MMSAKGEKYTAENIVDELRRLIREDIPEEFKEWAKDGITFSQRNPDADILDYPNNIFAYIKDEPMPQIVRELVEGIYLQEIKAGSGMAACNLGSLYYTGKIGEQSYEKAMNYYEIAADSGDAQALENLGYCYYYGRDCEVDYQKAFECFSKGAFCGSVNSLYKIGDMYKRGYYVNRDEREAYRIYSYCLDLINADNDAGRGCEADVFVRLGDCYLHATGCEQDTLKALFWIQRAEYEFRIKEANHDIFARRGIEWALRLLNECHMILDADYPRTQPC